MCRDGSRPACWQGWGPITSTQGTSLQLGGAGAWGLLRGPVTAVTTLALRAREMLTVRGGLWPRQQDSQLHGPSRSVLNPWRGQLHTSGIFPSQVLREKVMTTPAEHKARPARDLRGFLRIIKGTRASRNRRSGPSRELRDHSGRGQSRPAHPDQTSYHSPHP